MGKKEIALTAVLAVLVLGLVVGLCALKLSGGGLPPAEECGQLVLSVRYGNDQEYIKIWQDESGDCYFFLPANMPLENVRIANLGRGASLWLDDAPYRKADGLADIECGRAYEARMQTADGRVSSKSFIFMRSENLSALFINTESGVLDNIHADKTVKEAADLYLYDESGKKVYGKGISYIKCRGNTTFYEMEKKSYQIRFPREEALLGMEKAEKWVLLANSKDGSFLRNKIIYDFAGEYSDVEGMEGRYVDLYLNGQYEGNYYLCEKVEVGAGRVDIRNLEELNKTVNSEGTVKNAGPYLADDGSFKAVEGLTNPSDITGGYLVEFSMNGYDDSRSGFTTSRGHSFKIVSPEAASVEQVAYIRNLFNEFEAALAQEDGINPDTGKHISEYVDLEVWAQKFLIEEGFQNVDSGIASMYFYKDSDSVDPLIKAGPTWDYDRALGAFLPGRYTSLDDPRRLNYDCLYSRDMLQHEEVRELVCELLENWFAPYVERRLSADVADWEDYLRASVSMDMARWPNRADYYADYGANCEYIVEFMQARIDFLKDVFLGGAEYHTLTFLTVDGSPDFVYTIPHGGHMTEAAPIVTSYVGIFNGWKNTQTGVKYDARLPVLEDAIYEAQWIPADLIVLNGLGMAEAELEDVDVEALQVMVDMIREMQEAESDGQ